MAAWLNSKDGSKTGEYDFATTSDFLRNTSPVLSQVFSPVCSELNVLLQACAGEYAEADAGCARARLEEVLGEMNAAEGVFKALCRAYLPHHLVKANSGGSSSVFCGYDSQNRVECKELCERYRHWVLQESNGKLSDSIEESRFYEEVRMYFSLVYFKARWHTPFKLDSSDSDFHVGSGEPVKRRFMRAEGHFLYCSQGPGNDETGFEAVAVPYKDRRYCLVYIVPKKRDADLSAVWSRFGKTADEDIARLLGDKACTRYTSLELRVPRIALSSKLDLCDVLRSTYGCGPAREYVKSTMDAFIDINEEGTEAAALVRTDVADGVSSDPVVVADHPYIAVVYDRKSKRILFAIKDTGKAEK